jgi:hypothetical protein
MFCLLPLSVNFSFLSSAKIAFATLNIKPIHRLFNLFLDKGTFSCYILDFSVSIGISVDNVKDLLQLCQLIKWHFNKQK